MARLTVSAHTHAHTYIYGNIQHLYAGNHTHTHTGPNPKLPGDTLTHTCKSSITAPMQNREEEGAYILGPVGEPKLFRATGSLCRARFYS